MVVETIPETKPRSGSGEATAGRGRRHSRRRRDQRSPTDSLAWWIAAFLIAAAGVVGLVLRLWLVFHSPLTSDEAVVGLVAQGMLHGHFTAFFWGQQYGGTAEPAVLALFFLVLGQHGWVETLMAGFLSAVAAVLTWRVALRLVRLPVLALLAAALTWAAPEVVVQDSVKTWGFRGVALICGLLVLLMGLRVLDGRRGVLNFAALGLAAGVGWWSSPEIAYYAVPTLFILVVAFRSTRERRWRIWVPATLTAVVTVIVGAAPWLWTNEKSGFASLHTIPRRGPTHHPGILGRIPIFFRDQLPMSVGLRRAFDGVWLGSFGGEWLRVTVMVIVFAIIVTALFLCLARPGRTRCLALGVLLFPLMFILSPASWFWLDGRYDCFLPPLLALVLAVGCYEGAGRFRRLRGRHGEVTAGAVGSVEPGADESGPTPSAGVATLMMAGVVALSVTLTVVMFFQVIQTSPRIFTSTWGNPDAPTMVAIAKLEAEGVTTGYADYWVAYKLDFLSRGRLTITTAGYDADRSQSINKKVKASTWPAFLFVSRRQSGKDGTQFSAPKLIIGPDGVSESTFLATLQRLGVPHRIISTGILQAVVPYEPISLGKAHFPGL